MLKQGKEAQQVDSYRPVTICSLLSRTYWGIIDQKLRRRISFISLQKGFIHDASCFNDVHIPNEVMRLAKKSKGLVAVQLDISKAFDTIPHQDIGDTTEEKDTRIRGATHQ
jgi:hypothetical protein